VEKAKALRREALEALEKEKGGAIEAAIKEKDEAVASVLKEKDVAIEACKTAADEEIALVQKQCEAKVVAAREAAEAEASLKKAEVASWLAKEKVRSMFSLRFFYRVAAHKVDLYFLMFNESAILTSDDISSVHFPPKRCLDLFSCARNASKMCRRRSKRRRRMGGSIL